MLMSETTHRALRLALASLLIVALLSRLAITSSRADLATADFLSSFTLLSNAMAVLMLAMLAWHPERTSSRAFSTFRGAVTLYMIATGLAFAVVLAPAEAQSALTEPWVDWSLYVVGPVAVALDWVLYRPEVDLPQIALPIWLAFPVAYLAYSVIRGALVDRYPYPFLDPAQTDGYAGVAIWAGTVLVVVVGLGYACAWWANRRESPATA